MKYKEIITVTRPDVSIPFFSPECIHAPQIDGDYTSSTAHAYYVENYLNTGKCEFTEPSLSEDGLVLTLITIYLSADYISDLYNDSFFQSDLDVRTMYFNDNNIIWSKDIMPIND